jgi:hypothetical protein
MVVLEVESVLSGGDGKEEGESWENIQLHSDYLFTKVGSSQNYL